jgi:hypothetical protein
MASQPPLDASLSLRLSGDDSLKNISNELNGSANNRPLQESHADARQTAELPRMLRDDAFDLLSKLQDPALNLPPLARAVESSLWGVIKSCLDRGTLKDALTLWVKWYSLSSTYRPSQEIVSDRGYWSTLLGALQKSHGIANFQKYSLFILRRSLSLLEHDVVAASFRFRSSEKASYVAAYSKYCTFFETIVIGRYMNQVEECVRQFPVHWKDRHSAAGGIQTTDRTDQTADVSSLVLPCWWTILFEAALQQANSDVIRKAIGTYILEHYFPGAHTSKDELQENRYNEFLQTHYYPGPYKASS